MKEKYAVKGMTCAACQAHVQKAVENVPGVDTVAVNLLTNSMVVEGTAKSEAIIAAVEKAGYGAELEGAKPEKKKINNNETPALIRRLVCSAVLLLVLMYFSMGHAMWQWPVGEFFENNHVALAIFELLLSVAVMGINFKFFTNGFRSLWHRAPNMDALVALGSSAAFIYSVVILFLMSEAQRAGDMDKVMSYFHGLYFETSAMIPTLITIGKLLESISKGKTTSALESLMNLAPKTATLLRDGQEIEVPISEVRVGDIFVLRPGRAIPADGVVRSGDCAIDESALTGESIPVDKKENDSVSAGTINTSGYAECEVTKIGEDTTLAQIIKMVETASNDKAPIAKMADKVSYVFVPVIMGIAVIVLAAWLIYGGVKGSPDPTITYAGFALARAISVLVIACPCALGLATPVAIMVGNGVAARGGILFKTAEAIEETGKCQIVVFDKTGTLTIGKPAIKEFVVFGGDREQILTAVFSLESKSEHPLAKAIYDFGSSEGVAISEVEEFKTFAGNGLQGTINGQAYFVGNRNFISQQLAIPDEISQKAAEYESIGNTVIFVANNAELLAIFAISDQIKPEVLKMISDLKDLNVRIVMLTGDNERTACAIANELRIEEVRAEVLPGDKEAIIRELQKDGKVIMVGDGINDAPALTTANIGIGISTGTDIAMEAADVVISSPSMMAIPGAIRLSRKILWNIKENLFWAFFYNGICIPIAAGAIYFATGWAMNPMIGAAAMSLSSVTVVINALRLNLFKLYPDQQKKGKHMKQILHVEGMMCSHCEAHVVEALKKVNGVLEAKADHNRNEVVVEASREIAADEYKKAVEGAGYRFIGLK